MEEHTHNHKENKKQAEGEVQELAKEQDKVISIKESEYAKLEEQAKKAAEYWDKLLRLQADFDNTRKRLEREKQLLNWRRQEARI